MFYFIVCQYMYVTLCFVYCIMCTLFYYCLESMQYICFSYGWVRVLCVHVLYFRTMKCWRINKQRKKELNPFGRYTSKLYWLIKWSIKEQDKVNISRGAFTFPCYVFQCNVRTMQYYVRVLFKKVCKLVFFIVYVNTYVNTLFAFCCRHESSLSLISS